MSTTEVVPATKPGEPDRFVDLAHLSLRDVKDIGAVFVKSGFWKDQPSAAQAVTKILAGQELGVPPMQAMSQIHVVDGTPRLSAGLVGALVKRSGRYNYRPLEMSDTVCVIEWYDREFGADPVGRSEFSGADAEKAGLLQRKGSAWTAYREDMLFARALTRGARRFCPDVFGGAVYTTDETPTTDEPPPLPKEHFTHVKPPMVTEPELPPDEPEIPFGEPAPSQDEHIFDPDDPKSPE